LTLLTNDEGDTVTGTAEYKVCAAEVRLLESVEKQDFYPGSYYTVDGPGRAAD